VKRRRKRSRSTSSYEVVRLKRNLEAPQPHSNQSESLMSSRSKSPNTITIMMTPKEEDDPQTLLADQSSNESNLSLYNMPAPVLTRDLSLDVEPSLRLQAQGSNLSTFSRSNGTNLHSEGHDHKELDRLDRPLHRQHGNVEDHHTKHGSNGLEQLGYAIAMGVVMEDPPQNGSIDMMDGMEDTVEMSGVSSPMGIGDVHSRQATEESDTVPLTSQEAICDSASIAGVAEVRC